MLGKNLQDKRSTFNRFEIVTTTKSTNDLPTNAIKPNTATAAASTATTTITAIASETCSNERTNQRSDLMKIPEAKNIIQMPATGSSDDSADKGCCRLEKYR